MLGSTDTDALSTLESDTAHAYIAAPLAGVGDTGHTTTFPGRYKVVAFAHGAHYRLPVCHAVRDVCESAAHTFDDAAVGSTRHLRSLQVRL